MMSVVLFQVRAAMGNLVMALWHLLSFPFSRHSRRLNSRLWGVACDPFVLERISLSALLPEPFLITLGPLREEPHNASEYELLCLASLVKVTGAAKVFEIGTYDGRSARAMAMNLHASGRLFTLNLPPGEDRNAAGIQNVDSQLNTKVGSGFRFAATPEAERIEQLFGDSATFDFKSFEAQMDLVFIDGSHEFDYVSRDTKSAIRLLKPSGGWIVWHDAPLYGVAPYLTQQMRCEQWPVKFIEGTTLAVAYVEGGRVTTWPSLAGQDGRI